MLNVNKKTGRMGAETIEAWHTAALGCAWVAGVFSVVVATMLFFNAYRMRITTVAEEDALVKIKQDLPRGDLAPELLDQIRTQDTANRENRFRRLDYSRHGMWLLLGGVVVFFSSVKWRDNLKKKLPRPQPRPDAQQLQLRNLRLAGYAVGAGVMVFVLLSVVFAFKGEIRFSADDTAVAPYPTMDQMRRNWPAFRGPDGSGVVTLANIPAKWDAATGDGILWKSPVPLTGPNSPVIWDNRIFMTGSDDKNYVYQVYCYDADSGKLLWTGDVPNAIKSDGENIDVMEDTGLCAPTAVTDGHRVYAIFATGNVAAFDYNGKQVWLRKLGIPDSVYGYASSLAIYQDKVIVQFDQATADDGLSKLIALDAMTGKTAWETKRPVGNSWSSPIVVDIDGKSSIITAADPWVIAYDAATGSETWRAECIMGDVAPSPVYSKGLVFAIEPYSRLVAVRTGGTGNVTGTHIAWFAEDDIPDICSPLSTGELVYILTTDGLITCYKTADGEKLWDHEIEKSTFNASPCLVGDKIYLLSVKGVMRIIKTPGEYAEIAVCDIGEKCYASPAFADGRIYIRGVDNLYCIGSGK
jgi:outer membrane protein assembly factor BamB